MANERKIVILGGGYAGLLCALRLGRGVRGRAAVTLVNGSEHFVERIRLHQLAAGDELAVRSIPRLLDTSGARFQKGYVRAIHPRSKAVDVDGHELRYDQLVIALGSHTDRHAAPGAAEHAYTLDHESATRLRKRLPELVRAAARIVVCGGGLTAIELASELAERFPALRISLHTSGAVGGFLSAGGRAHILRTLQGLGVTVVENAAVEEVRASEIRTGGAAVPFDACIWATGFQASPLIAAAGLLHNERGQARVDACLRSLSFPESIHVAGDAASPLGSTFAPLTMSCKTALPMGAHVADNLLRVLAGQPEAPLRFGDSGYCISLGRRQALIQRAERDGAIRDQIHTGRLAAFLKEQVCRYTTRSLALEAGGWLRYRWLSLPHSGENAAKDAIAKAQTETLA